MSLKEIDIPFATPIPILIENTFTKFKYSSFSKGYHVHKDVWIPIIGEGYHVHKDVWIPIIGDDSLTCEQEEHNESDKNVIAIIWDFMEMQEL